jgi:hypothetical protein
MGAGEVNTGRTVNWDITIGLAGLLGSAIPQLRNWIIDIDRGENLTTIVGANRPVPGNLTVGLTRGKGIAVT